MKLTPVLPGKDVFAIKNRAGDVVAELSNAITKLNSASRSFQVLKLNSMTSEIYCYILLKPSFFILFNIYRSIFFILINIYI